MRDAILAHELLAQRQVTRSAAPLAAYRLAVASTLMQDDLDATVSRAWQRTLATLRRAGARIEEINLTEISQLQPFRPPAASRRLRVTPGIATCLNATAAAYDPRVQAASSAAPA